MKYDMSFYKEQFNKVNKGDLFEINQPFIEELISIKERMDVIKSHALPTIVMVHPKYPEVVKVPESENYLMKLESIYKDMTMTLNRILGVSEMEPLSPMEVYIRDKGRNKPESD